MSLGVTLCFYLVIGAAVAVALLISEASALRFGRLYIAATALLFWPLYLPVLLAADRSMPQHNGQSPPEGQPQQLPNDEMAVAISQVERELDAALNSLNGWAEAVLSPEADQFAKLRFAWHQQAERVRELDRLLSSNAHDAPSAATMTEAMTPQSSSANQIMASERLRQENLAKLGLVRQQCHFDLLATLAKVRQLVTLIHIAHYTGAPASSAAELVQQIAAAVEDLAKGTQ